MIEINKVILIGRIAQNLELRRTNSDLLYCKFTLAVNRRFKNKNGDYDVDFINCVAWKGVAENLVNYMGKGSKIGVEGNIQTGSYEKNGQRIYTTDVVVEQIEFLEAKKENTTQQNNNYQSYNQDNNNEEEVSPNAFLSDDDMPFYDMPF